jgi:hypothetical protein
MNNGSGFFIAGQWRCMRCAVSHPPLLTRSLKTSAVVGTILVMINVGPSIIAGEFSKIAWWRAALNYVVPFCVATWGALGNAQSKDNDHPGRAEGD